jgi:DNA-binding NarL/FixJ family response regulator
MRADGIGIEEIAGRIKKSPEFVERMIEWTKIPRTGRTTERHLTPRQRRVLDLRADGETHRQIGERFKRGEAYIRQIEGLAHFKEAQRILTRD